MPSASLYISNTASSSAMSSLSRLRSEMTLRMTLVSYPRALAIGLQLVAAVCFLGAFYVGGAADPTAFARWMAGAIALQLAVIAMLLFDR